MVSVSAEVVLSSVITGASSLPQEARQVSSAEAAASRVMYFLFILYHSFRDIGCAEYDSIIPILAPAVKIGWEKDEKSMRFAFDFT